MKDVIDVRAREVKSKPKFLTGTPAWMNNPVGKAALTIYGFAMLIYVGSEVLNWLAN